MLSRALAPDLTVPGARTAASIHAGGFAHPGRALPQPPGPVAASASRLLLYWPT